LAKEKKETSAVKQNTSGHYVGGGIIIVIVIVIVMSVSLTVAVGHVYCRSPERRLRSAMVQERARPNHRAVDVPLHARVLAVQAQPGLAALSRHLPMTPVRHLSTSGREM